MIRKINHNYHNYHKTALHSILRRFFLWLLICVNQPQLPQCKDFGILTPKKIFRVAPAGSLTLSFLYGDTPFKTLIMRELCVNRESYLNLSQNKRCNYLIYYEKSVSS